MSNRPLVSIISVNYNQKEETFDFLDSVEDSDYENIEVILVDNGSKDPIGNSIEKKYNNLTYLYSENNLGFAGGNNLGMVSSKGKYLVFLNNDTIIPPDFISKMVSFMESDKTVGMASPKVVFPDGTIQYAGAIEINLLTGRGKRIGLFEKDNGQYDRNYETDLPHGAAMITRRDIVGKVGLMPEEYFLYYEEHDWCLKIKNEAYKMFFVGETSVIHKESVSVGVDSPLKVYYMNRNRILFLRRNASGFSRFSGILFYLMFALPKNTISYILKGKGKQLSSLWRGVLWHLNQKYDFKS